jgi:membrane peptidoglycan carboxypeptidase
MDLPNPPFYGRKLLEAALASRIERRFTKEEILQLYMNRIYFGSGLYGIERAAQGYY